MDADQITFSALFERHRRALQAHCYRMVGSFEESEDLVQETFVRAWRARKRFRREGRWSFRAWLYRIATNACLDHLARRSPRLLPADVASAADPEVEPPPVAADVAWLDPYPDRLVDPHEAAAPRETPEIAFVAAGPHPRPPHPRALLVPAARGLVRRPRRVPPRERQARRAGRAPALPRRREPAARVRRVPAGTGRSALPSARARGAS